MKFESESRANFIVDENVIEIEDSSTPKAKVRIEASHAGKVNGNHMFYTPRALRDGAETLNKPFPKHVQSKHYSKAVGVITTATYVDDGISSEYRDRLENTQSAKELVSTVNEYLKSDEYKSRKSKGFGSLVATADIYNPKKINELRSKNRGSVSIGGDSTRAFCNICSTEGLKCKHTLGQTYNGSKAIAIVDMLNLDHIGFENIPADSETNTIIISDSQEEDSNKIEILELSKADQGNQMTDIVDSAMSTDDKKLSTEELQSKIADHDSHLDSMGLGHHKKHYKKKKEEASRSQFVFPRLGLLPTNSMLGACVAYHTAKDWEDGEDKEDAMTHIQAAVDEHFDGRSPDAVYEDLRNSPAEGEGTLPDDQQTASGTVGGTGIADSLTVEGAVETAEVVAEVVAVADGAIIPEIVAEVVPEVIETAIEYASVAVVDALRDRFDEFNDKLDSHMASMQGMYEGKQRGEDRSLMKQHLDATKADLAASKLSENSLTTDLKHSIINHISLLKNLPEDSDYKQSLQSRSIDALKMTLADTLYQHGSPTKSDPAGMSSVASISTNPSAGAVTTVPTQASTGIRPTSSDATIDPKSAELNRSGVQITDAQTLEESMNSQEVTSESKTDDTIVVQDALKTQVDNLLKDVDLDTLDKKKFQQLHKEAVRKHGLTAAKELTNTLRNLNKIPK